MGNSLITASLGVLRMRELYRQRVLSKDSLDDAENQLSVTVAALKRSEGAIDYAKFEVSQCVIRAPISGVVLQKYREVGDTINFGGTIQAGGGATDIAQLADLSDLRCEVDISESDIAKVTMGSPATVIPDAFPDHPFPASVVKIYPEADRQKGTVKVEVRILQPDLKIIKPEMSAKVSFESIEEGDTLELTLNKEWAGGLAIAITRLVEAGRPPCPLCGGPLDSRGHDCPRTNGHRPPIR